MKSLKHNRNYGTPWEYPGRKRLQEKVTVNESSTFYEEI